MPLSPTWAPTTTITPASTKRCAWAREVVAPAEKSATSSPDGSAVATSSTTTSPAAPVAPGTNGIGMLYKSMQYGYFARTGSFGKLSLLVFKDDFQKTETVEGVTTFKDGVNSRVTVGGALFSKLSGNLNLNAEAY